MINLRRAATLIGPDYKHGGVDPRDGNVCLIGACIASSDIELPDKTQSTEVLYVRYRKTEEAQAVAAAIKEAVADTDYSWLVDYTDVSKLAYRFNDSIAKTPEQVINVLNRAADIMEEDK